MKDDVKERFKGYLGVGLGIGILGWCRPLKQGSKTVQPPCGDKADDYRTGKRVLGRHCNEISAGSHPSKKQLRTQWGTSLKADVRR